MAKEKSSKKQRVEKLRILDALIRQANSFLGSDTEIPRKVVTLWHAKARVKVAPSPREWLAFGFILGEISERLRLQNGYLLAPIFFGAALTVSGMQLSAVPHWMTEFAQLMFGLVVA